MGTQLLQALNKPTGRCRIDNWDKGFKNEFANFDSRRIEEADDIAPLLPLPDTVLMTVQYPGFVKNTDRALNTLGGLPAVGKVRSNRNC